MLFSASRNKNELPALKEKVSKPRGSNNPKTNEARKYGQERHKQFKDDNDHIHIGKIDDKNIPDLHTEKVVHELKPATVSGVYKGNKQLDRYIDASRKPGLLHLYQPENQPIDLDSIVKKNFKADPVVKKIQELSKKNGE